MASMTPAEYRAALETLGLGVNEFARICGMEDPRRARRWAEDDDAGPSPIAAAFLRYMIRAEAFFVVHAPEDFSDPEESNIYLRLFREATREL